MKREYDKKVPRMTPEEWTAEGKRLFGDDYNAWKFKCPICGHVQSVGDFRQFKDQGGNMNSAYQQCIGRFMKDPVHRPFGETVKGEPKQPCDYAIYGLFCFPAVVVVFPDGHETPAFAFAEVGQ
jgi:hypothetical protein